MSDQILDSPILFPVFFALIWIGASVMLGFMSGWFNLQQFYPDNGTEEPLLKLRWQSGMMGFGVALNSVLTLSACRSGLSVRIWRIFGPFQMPLLVPWSEIYTEVTRTFFTPMVRLNFGNPPKGKLKISIRSWSRLIAAAKTVASTALPDAPEISRRLLGERMALEWLVLTAIGSAFFIVVTSSWGDESRVPIALCIGLPAITFGIGQLVRFARDR